MTTLTQLLGSALDGESASAQKGETDRRDLLRQGIELAYFLTGNRRDAIEILCSALDKWQNRSFQETRRFYWRDKHPNHSLRRITRSDIDVLQWLIMSEAEQYEQPREQLNQCFASEMVLHFIRHLVTMTTAMSSFHVNVGINRLLYTYTTSQSQAAYGEIGGRSKSADEYRRTKGVLMARMLERFNGRLGVDRRSRGEICFELHQDQSSWSALVRECLEKFTPWSTLDLCPTDSTRINRELLSGDQNQADIGRCHILIDPRCHGLLMKDISSQPPDQRLAVPVLAHQGDQNDRGIGHREVPPALTNEEQSTIERYLEENQRRRKEMTAGSIRVLLDGNECARVTLHEEPILSIRIEEGVREIEVRSVIGEEDLLLATHLVRYDDSGLVFDKAYIPLGTSRIELEVKPKVGSSATPQLGTAQIRYRCSSPVHRFRLLPFLRSLEVLSKWRYIAAWSTSVLLMSTLLTFLMKKRFAPPYVPERPVSVLDKQHSLIATSATEHYRLIADEDLVRDVGSAAIPIVHIPADVALIKLALPLRARTKVAQGFRVELSEVDQLRPFLIYNSVNFQQSADGELLLLEVPAASLSAGHFYSIRVTSQPRPGKYEQSFSFQVATPD